MTSGNESPSRAKVSFFVLLIVLLVGLVFFVGLKLNHADQLRVREANGYCPTGTRAQVREGIRIPGHTVILVDTSNQISEENGEKAFKRIVEWTRDAFARTFPAETVHLRTARIGTRRSEPVRRLVVHT